MKGTIRNRTCFSGGKARFEEFVKNYLAESRSNLMRPGDFAVFARPEVLRLSD